eukprot:s5569_g3.t1
MLFQSSQHPLPESEQRLAHLPLPGGGLGLRSAVDAAPLGIVGRLLVDHSGTGAAGSLSFGPGATVRDRDRCTPCSCPSRGCLPLRAGMGFAAAGAAATRASKPRIRRLSAGLAASGYDTLASIASDKRALELHLSHLDAASRALLLSQAGSHAARAFTVFPTSAELTVTSPLFRVLLLRRLRLPLPVAPRTCACVVALTHSAITELPAQLPECSPPGPSLLNALLRGSAKKPV